MARAKAIRGRIVRRVDPLQEKLGIELLKGAYITLDGDVYHVGGFLEGGDKVELWRQSKTQTPNAGAKRRSDAELRGDEVPIANPAELANSKRLWLFHFGAYGDTYVYVWEDSEESAFEHAVEWLDENAPGHLVDLTAADLKAAAKDEGIEWDDSWDAGASMDDPAFEQVVQAAEADLTMIGHTTLKHGQYLVSHEWAFDEITDEAEREEVAVESFEWGGGDYMLDIDYHSEGPDKDEPTSGLSVSRDAGYVDITEWTDIYAATGEPESEGDVLRVDAHVPLDEVLDPKGKHRGTYSGDKGMALGAILLMEPRDQEKSFVAAAIAYLGYYGGEETHVSYVGE